MTVSVSGSKRLLGVHVLRPGLPTTLSLPRAGRVKLSWKTPAGQAVSRNFVVARPTDGGQLSVSPEASSNK
jgi:hypothetical protein